SLHPPGTGLPQRIRDPRGALHLRRMLRVEELLEAFGGIAVDDAERDRILRRLHRQQELRERRIRLVMHENVVPPLARVDDLERQRLRIEREALRAALAEHQRLAMLDVQL